MSQNRNEILVKQGGTAEVKPFGPFDRSDQQGIGWLFFLKNNNTGAGKCGDGTA